MAVQQAQVYAAPAVAQAVPVSVQQVYAQAAQLPSKPYPSVEGLKKMQQIYNWREMQRHKVEDFYDASFVAELDKSGYIDGLYKAAAMK